MIRSLRDMVPAAKFERIFWRAVWLVLVLLPLAPRAARADLKPETTTAYAKYIAALESRLQTQNNSASDFLWVDRDPGRLQSVRNGAVATQVVKQEDLPGGGMLQHWVGAVFIPGVTLARVRQVDEDYVSYARFYAPDISHVRVLDRAAPNRYLVSYRIRKKQVLTVVMDTTHEILYIPLSRNRLAEQSRSTSVRQVEDAGTPSEHVLPLGKGDGFLWSMNSYWRLEERDGGVYVECEAVTLSRDVPLGMGQIVGPVLRSFAEDSLKTTLDQKRRAVVGR